GVAAGPVIVDDAGGVVGVGKELDETFGGGVDAARTDDVEDAVALHAGPVGGVGNNSAGGIEGVIEGDGATGGIDIAAHVADLVFIERRGDQGGGLAVAGGGAFVGEEEEGLVAAVENLRNVNRAPEAAAGVPLPDDRAAGGREGEAAGVEDFVA